MSQNGPHIAHDRLTKQHETKSNKIKQRQQPCTARNHSGHDTLRAWQSGATFNVGKVWRNPHLKDLQCNVGCVLPASGTGQTPRQLHFRQLGGSKCYGISCRIKPFGLRVSHPLLVVTVQTTLKNSNALHLILCTEHR